MNCLLKGLIIGALIFAVTTVAMSAQLSGTVVGVKGLDVTVQVDGELMPLAGDQMEISFTLPDGEALSIGTWRVNGVSSNYVLASVVNNTGTPIKGERAIIFSENPVPMKSVTETKASPTKEINQLGTYSDSPGIASVSSGAREVIELLRSPETADKRNGAKKAYKKYTKDAAVIAVVADELKKGYAEKPRDKYHIDAMAWLCNSIGASGEVKYKELLTLVSRESRSKKIRNYAAKNMRRLH